MFRMKLVQKCIFIEVYYEVRCLAFFQLLDKSLLFHRFTVRRKFSCLHLEVNAGVIWYEGSVFCHDNDI